MPILTGVICQGRLEIQEPIALPDGTVVDVRVEPSRVVQTATDAQPAVSYRDFILSLAGSFGDEPFERPPQGEFEKREDW